jgi:hypothetical protein
MVDYFKYFNCDTNGIVILSCGLGQESSALLILLLTNKKIYDKYVGEKKMIVVFSDTGDEHDETYEFGETVKQLCAENGVEFHFLSNDKGYHSDAWLSLSHQYKRTSTMGSVAFSNSACTQNLKLAPIHRWADAYISENYGFEKKRGKKAIINFAYEFGKIDMMIGFNSEEENRIRPMEQAPAWEQKCFNKVYPLVELGITREMSQKIIIGAGVKLPPPSHCKFCHYQSVIEIYYKKKYEPVTYRQLIEIENNKLEKFAHKGEKNLCFFGTRKTIDETVNEAEEKEFKKYIPGKILKEWTFEELVDYKMSHGHCMSKGY